MTAAKDQHFVPDETAKDVIDKALQFGKYQSLLIWIFGTSIGNPLVFNRDTPCFFISAFIGAVDYIQLVFMLNDRQEWSCLQQDVERCNESEQGVQSICEGGEVVFNTSHPNYLHSLVVEHKWLCQQVLN